VNAEIKEAMMKVFVAGATGALGGRLVPILVASGHDVVGMTRSPEKAVRLRELGAEAVVADGLDRKAVIEAVTRAEPEVVIHQMTALGNAENIKHFDREFAVTNRLRTTGLDYLLAAARMVGTRRLITQSYGGWPQGLTGGTLKTEEEPLDPALPKEMAHSFEAIRYLESTVLDDDHVEGVALRYGGFYGPGTLDGAGGSMVEMVRKRRLPIIGNGEGIWSFVHVDDAATATMLAMDRGAPGIYNVADDDPAPVKEWLPEMAEAVGAKPPRHVPTWVGRLAAGEVGVTMFTKIRGVSNEKAKRELGWRLIYPSWRQGFRAWLGQRNLGGGSVGLAELGRQNTRELRA
jgi:2-alkyl-3-oxoalkanoate reductase